MVTDFKNDLLRAALDNAQSTVNRLIAECRAREMAAAQSRRQLAAAVREECALIEKVNEKGRHNDR